MQTFTEMLEDSVRRSGDTVISCSDGPMSYAELAAEAAQVAGGLRRLGVGPGDRVGFWLPNLRAWLVLFAACCRIGAIAVAMNIRFRRGEIEDVVQRARPAVIAFVPRFGQADHVEILAGLGSANVAQPVTLVQCGEGPPVTVQGARVLPYAELARAPEPADGGDEANQVCCIFLTSGTTSRPKFAMHRQQGVVRHSADVARVLHLQAPGTMVLHALPFCGVFGFSLMTASLLAGVPMVVPERFEAEHCAGLMRRHRVTHLAGSDDMFHRLLLEGDRLSGGDNRPFPDLRCCPYAQFNPGLADFPARAADCGIPLLGPFGMSEIFSLFALRSQDDPEDLRAQAGGYPVSQAGRVRVRDPETGEIAPHGSVGEIEVRSPTMFSGYFEDQAATAAAMTDDGYLRTGDLGSTAPDGSFTYLARMGDALRLGGFLVNPLEIETRLCAHPGVADAQVVAVATERGSRPVAFVIPEDGSEPDEQTLIGYCASHLAPFKVPVRCLTVTEFPVTEGPNGTKIRKGLLREMAGRALAP